jgi:hypothetical protein
LAVKIDGSCHCGAIRYEAEVDPGKVSLCHCTDCQVLSGSAFRFVVRATEADFRILAGTPKIYVKTAESGAKRVQAFCPDCGTPLYATSAGDGPKMFGIRLGTARQRRELAPKRQFWCRSALEWLPLISVAESCETQP